MRTFRNPENRDYKSLKANYIGCLGGAEVRASDV